MSVSVEMCRSISLAAQTKPLLDEQSTKCQPYRLYWRSSGGIELRGICFFQLFPWNQRGKEHPVVTWLQCTAKRQMKILD